MNAETAARVELAAQLENELESSLILLCGWDYRPDCDITIADAMKNYLIENFTIEQTGAFLNYAGQKLEW